MACGDDDPATAIVDADGDGWPSDLDCDDEDATVFPAADEILDDGIDQDCSGSDATANEAGGGAAGDGGETGAGGCVDCSGAGGSGGAPSTSVDLDGDGFENDVDCDDENRAVRPNAPEIPFDGVDQNCDGSDLPAFVVDASFLGEAAAPSDPIALARGFDGNGGEVVLAVWSDSRVAPRQDLYARLLDASGLPLGDEIEIDTEDNAAKYDVHVASKEDGFLVLWSTNAGVRGRLLAEDGEPLVPEGETVPLAILQMGDAGSAAPKAAFAGNWGLVWRTTLDGGLEFRALTSDGVRGDIAPLVGEEVADTSIQGTENGFVIAWEGRNEGAVRGVFTETRSVDGSVGTVPVLVAESGRSPRLTANGEGFLAHFLTPGPFSRIEARPLTASGTPTAAARPVTLEGIGLAEVRTAFVPGPLSWRLSGGAEQASTEDASVFLAYRDGRYEGAPTFASAIQANAYEGDEPLFPAPTALLVDSTLRLGDVVSVDGAVWMSVATSTEVGLVRIGE